MIIDWLEEWFKGVLIDGIIGNLSGLFDTVNTKVGEIAADVGATPQGWNSGIFNMIHNLSESVIIPIADNLRKLNTFSDMSKRHWAYYAVMEAANAHTAILGDSESWSK